MNEVVVRLSETDKAYFAGLVDSLGSIKVDRRYRGSTLISREIKLTLRGLSKGQVDWISAKFKHARIMKPRVQKNTAPWGLYFVTRWAATALTEILGHIIAKDKEARLVFKFASAVAKQGRRLTEDHERIRAEVDRELGALKRGA